MHTSIHSGGTGNHPAFPHANGSNGLWRTLPGDEFVFATVVGELTTCLRPVGPTRLRRLDTSNGCQDHTLLPSASAPLVLRVCRSLTGEPALRSRFAPDAATSTASHPNVRDDREPPLFSEWDG